MDFQQIYPLTSDRLPGLEALFGAHGAFGGCWCMFFRLSNKDWGAQSGEERKAGLHRIVDSGTAPGLLAYDGEKPVGWISLGPRPDFKRLERSRTAKPIDDQPVWSVVCFFVEKSYRRKGLTVALLKAGIDFARQHGAVIVEGYPVDAAGDKPDPWVYQGLVGAFKKAGFIEAGRHLENRPIMRYYMEPK
ncbi:MAG TPA: GNAT family N-acetyltransferase [Anaerolineaceae bacterium]